MKLSLYPHQQWVVDNARKYEGLWLKTGTGKTHATFGLIEKHKPETSLVVCPKIKVTDWQETAEELGIKIDVLSKENFAKKWDDLPYYDFLAIDEIHFFWAMKMKTPKGKVTIAGSLKKYLKKHSPSFFYGLSATPYRGSNPWDLYSAWYVFTGSYPAMGFKKFQEDFFVSIKIGARPVWKAVVSKKNKQRLINGFNKLGITLRSDQAFDMPPIIETKEIFQPTVSQHEAYQEMLSENSEAVQIYTYGYQIYGGGCRKGDEYRENEYYTSDKFDALIDIIDTEPRIACVFRHNLEIDRVAEESKKRWPKRNIYIVRGGQKPDFKEINTNTDKDAIVLIQAQSAVGFDLIDIDIMVFYTLSFSYVDYEQARGRTTRGKNVESFDSLRYIHLITMGTIDEHIHKKILAKEDFSIALYKDK